MKKLVLLIGLVALVSICFFGAARVFKGYSPTQAITFFYAPSPGRLCEIGAPIAQLIESYYRVHGRYPLTFNDAGVAPAETFFGPWLYRVSEDGQSCTLSIGDYGRYGFEVWWSPEGEEGEDVGWYIDT